jgi:hypothetical protein
MDPVGSSDVVAVVAADADDDDEEVEQSFGSVC